MAAILAVVLIASVCYTATVFAWFGASVTNEGSTITAASYGMTMSYRANNGNDIQLIEDGLYADGTISVPLDEYGAGTVDLTLGQTEETQIDSHYDLEVRAPVNVKLTLGAQSEASTVTSNGTVNVSTSDQFKISISGSSQMESVELRILCATTYAVDSANSMPVIYVDDEKDLSDNINPGAGSYVYFLTDHIDLSDEDLTFSGTGSVTIYLNGKTLKLGSMTVAVADNTVRFASVSGGTLVLGGETIRDTDTDKILPDGSGSLHVSLSDLAEEPAESVSPPAALTAVPEEPATVPAGLDKGPAQEPTESVSDIAPAEESEPAPEETLSNPEPVSETMV